MNYPSELVEEPENLDEITPYDRAHFATYLSLLYATGAGQSDDEIARNILGIDPDMNPERAHRTLASHLNRARWLAEGGYKHLLDSPDSEPQSQP